MKSKQSQAEYSIVHGIFLVLNLLGFAWYISDMRDIHYLFKYFSLHAFWMALFYSITSLLESTKNSKINRVIHQIAITSNVAIFLGYWVIVRPTIVGKISQSFLYCNDFTHTMPISMLLLINFREQLLYFNMETIKYQTYYMLFGFVVNVVYTFWEGPVYSFMDYDDIGTPIFLFGGYFMLIFLFWVMNKITNTRLQKKQVKQIKQTKQY